MNQERSVRIKLIGRFQLEQDESPHETGCNEFDYEAGDRTKHC